MKKLVSIIISILFLASVAHAQTSGTMYQLNAWKVSGTTITPVINTNSLTVPQLGGSGVRCIQTDNNGLMSVAAAACGSGSGGGGVGTSTNPFMASYFVATSTSIASTFPYASTTALSVSGLTSGRIPVAGFGGLLRDYSALTFDGTNFKVEGNAEIGVSGEGNLTIRDAGGGTVIYLSGNTTDSYFNNGSANFGVGTTIPLAELHVQDTSGPQFRVGYNVSNYYDTSISSTGGVTFDSVGTGSKFSFLDNVGIGTTTPLSNLHLSGTPASIGGRNYSLLINPILNSQAARFAFSGGGNTNGVLMGESSNNTGDFAIYTASDVNITSGTATWGNAKFIVTNTGLVGVGTTSPVAGLAVNSTNGVFIDTAGGSPYGNASLYVKNSGSASNFYQLKTESGVGTNFVVTNAGKVGIGTTTPFGKLSIKGDGTSTGKTMVVSDSSSNIIMSMLDNGRVKIGSTTPATNLFDVDGVISSGADGNIGGGELRSYQVPGFYVGLKTDTTVNKSGLYRSNAGGDKFFSWYNTGNGDTGIATVGGAGTNIILFDNANEAMRIRNSMVSIGAAKFPAHSLDVTQPAMSTAKTASYDAIKATNTATSSTASVRMSGIETVVTGANSGAGASNVGVYVSSVSGGTANYDAIFNGTGVVGIGTTTPTTRLQVNGTTATSTISATVVNGSTRSTTIGGKIILQDMNGGTCTEITTQTGVISSRAVACP